MRSHNLFLLVYLLGSCSGETVAQRNASCASTELCHQGSGPVSAFLGCVGLPPVDTETDHVQQLKGILEGLMNIFTFMRSSMRGIPILTLEGGLQLSSDPYQNEAVVEMWLHVKIKPLLKSITRKFLSCLSTKNFSCSTYQMVVKELSDHYSEMNEARRQWIYNFFIYPFLSGERVAGCVAWNENNAQWLLRNFGAFRAFARIQDFSKVNLWFSGLEVLNLLSQRQKAELMLTPEVAKLDNGTLALVFNTMTNDSGHHPTTSPVPLEIIPPNPYRPPSLAQAVNGFMMAFKPAARLAHQFVAFAHERTESKVTRTALAQFLLNFTLAELAENYRHKLTPAPTPITYGFQYADVEEWYLQIVAPLLRRFLKDEEAVMNQYTKFLFHQVFYLDRGVEPGDHGEFSEIEDACSITLDKAPCGLTDAVMDVAHILQCAARTNLTLSEATVMRLIVELTERLNALIEDLSKANFTELALDLQEIFHVDESPSLTQDNLNDPDFIRLWFRVKLKPFLPDVPKHLLRCLSSKNFSCPVFQTIVAELSSHFTSMGSNWRTGSDIYQFFIYNFLRHHNTGDPQCVSSARNSTEWLMKNFGYFARFARVNDFYSLNPNFSGLEVLPILTIDMTTELLLTSLLTPPEKAVLIDGMLDYYLESVDERRLVFFLRILAYTSQHTTTTLTCRDYQQIISRLYKATPSLSFGIQPDFLSALDNLVGNTPQECLSDNISCPVIQFNSTLTCRHVNSTALESSLNMHGNVSCSFTLETYACAKLMNFTANQLVSLLKCNLTGNSSHSLILWNILLSKLSMVLDPALDILASMPNTTVIPSAREVLSVVGKLRVIPLTDEELRNSSVITKWFSVRLSRLLPSASGKFLRCVARRNISCSSYQQILRVLSPHFTEFFQRYMVVRDFINPYLSHFGPECLVITNGSVDWLLRTLGPFSDMVLLSDLLRYNPTFNPLEALVMLAARQLADLLVLDFPGLPTREFIINAVFDHLAEPSNEIKYDRFLSYLSKALVMNPFNCSTFKILFNRIHMNPYQSLNIGLALRSISWSIPPGCIINSGECNVTIINETEICTGVNSTTLDLYLHHKLVKGSLCDFTVKEFACANITQLSSMDLAEFMACDHTSDPSSTRPVWKLFLSKAGITLKNGLFFFASKNPNPRDPALTIILDVFREIRLDVFGTVVYNVPTFMSLTFEASLRPLLPAVSADFLSCLATKDFNCSVYQRFVRLFNELQPRMELSTQISVYKNFMRVFLTNNTSDPSCSSNTNNSDDWLQRNLGNFSIFPSFHELLMVYPEFMPLEALPLLTARQLAEVTATPGQLTSADQVVMVTDHIPNQQLAAFFDDVSPAVMGHQQMFPPEVTSALLQVVFDRANLSNASVSDSVLTPWINRRLPPLLFNLSADHVGPYFGILQGRNCIIQEEGVAHLNSTISSLSEVSQQEIHRHVILSLRESLRCFDGRQSFYVFLRNRFQGFQFPNLTSFLSVIPPGKLQEVLNSMPPSDLRRFLSLPGAVDNDALLCTIYDHYNNTPIFLETESLPEAVRRPTLPCVWPVALRSPNRSEANAWFNRRLRDYLPFLTRSLIDRTNTYNPTCPAFQDFVSALGEFNYTAGDFMRRDVFNTVREFLTSDGVPRCYDPNNPELNSTAWFAEYIGPFMAFLTLEDLQMFGSTDVIQVFAVNRENIALLNHSVLPVNLTNFYTELIYRQDSNFNPLNIPTLCRCVAPGPAFTQLTASQTMTVLSDLMMVCTDLDPQISAALAGNFETIDASAIEALGTESSGISTGQLENIDPQDLAGTVGVLSNVTNWNQGQVNAIVRVLISAGLIQTNSSASLVRLGSLVAGIQSSMIRGINGSQVIAASRDPSFVANLRRSPRITRRLFVQQIISVNANSDNIIGNVPAEVASEIPRVLLLSFSNNSDIIIQINQQQWNRRQAEVIFDLMVTPFAINVVGGVNNLSSFVLQGFTCTGVRNSDPELIRGLVQASRREGERKVMLVETQLTCMYNHIRQPDATSFTSYPPDLLLYYEYSLVAPSSCRSYFQELGSANFFIVSPTLRFIWTELLSNARTCLGITSTSLTADDIMVLGNMACTLNSSYIQNSDPIILEIVRNCPELDDAQVVAVFAQLQSGNTQFGNPSNWTEETLRDLGILPLYLNSTFYGYFDTETKRSFLMFFLDYLVNIGVDRQRRVRVKEEIRRSLQTISKRSTGCTVGNITAVTISNEAFPFDYNINQFRSCLSATTVRNNLAALTEKVDEPEYQEVILVRLREAYPNGSIPEDQVQLLSLTSRQASEIDVELWNITRVDTLAALFRPEDGPWNQSLARAIISKYLRNDGNELGGAELTAIRGINLCSLDVEVLERISPQSLRDAAVLNVSSCSYEKIVVLFNIARTAFASNARTEMISSSVYQQLQPYIGGADDAFVRQLLASDVNMDGETLTRVNDSILLTLSVGEVAALLGDNVRDLILYQNHPVINEWIGRQLQSQLNTLGIGLQGGRSDPTTAPTTATPPVTTGTTVATMSTGSTTPSGCDSVHIHPGFTILALLITFQLFLT
ncbi:uncharacterized protein [Antennarius striatus]|uniref:uncharacterized protein n=1 Tax=Antennarius striatus TaxID=241820 RepID=UPI0035AE4920